MKIVRPADSSWITLLVRRLQKGWRECKQKRGCRAGYLARQKSAPHRPPQPSLFVANVRSLWNKMDKLRLGLTTRTATREACVMIITETWLHPGIPVDAIELAGQSTLHSNRNKESGMTCRGGLCIYTNNCWCTGATVIDRHCSLHLEFLEVKCRPFYLPREFSVIVTAVYIPPDANAKLHLATC